MTKEFHRWEVWFADFPFEDDAGRSKDRPVIILSINPLTIATVKVTSQSKRTEDPYDVEIKFWKEAKFEKPSVARVSKQQILSKALFRRCVGRLHPQDALNIMNTAIRFTQDQKALAELEKSVAEEKSKMKIQETAKATVQPTQLFNIIEDLR